MTNKILNGDVLEMLKTLPDESVQCVVTSPPYWGLRSYLPQGHPDKHLEIGSEETPQEYVAKMVEVFREVHRVLKDDGALWLNLGDTYAASRSYQVVDNKYRDVGNKIGHKVPPGYKQKDLIGIPWRVAFALQADGWYLRQDIIWQKPNPMPESVKDRCTKAHEYVFLLTKSARYFWDAEAVKEEAQPTRHAGKMHPRGWHTDAVPISGGSVPPTSATPQNGRNIRSVWTIPTSPTPEAHFATFPQKLAETCIKAGSKEGDTILDPFYGAGTVGIVCKKLGRDCIGIELNEEYVAMAEKRIERICGGLF